MSLEYELASEPLHKFVLAMFVIQFIIKVSSCSLLLSSLELSETKVYEP